MLDLLSVLLILFTQYEVTCVKLIFYRTYMLSKLQFKSTFQEKNTTLMQICFSSLFSVFSKHLKYCQSSNG